MNQLAADQLAQLIPHAGDMVLLEEVIHWDEREIVARTRSHRRANNPLRDADGLHVACAIEYAAQAMAVHGALREPPSALRRGGMLASLRDVRLAGGRLDLAPDALIVRASLHSGDTRLAMYEFEVSAGGRALANGRASVILRL
jgi:predicted hotdog family 3-hydroxylacyl-ACP dehydratase